MMSVPNKIVNRSKLLLALVMSIALTPLVIPIRFLASTSPIDPNPSSPARALNTHRASNFLNQPTPLFEANEGQFDKAVQFFSKGEGYNLFLTSNEAIFSLGQTNGAKLQIASGATHQSKLINTSVGNTAVRMTIVGSNPKARLEGVSKQLAKTNYFVGQDPKNWRTNVSNFESVKYLNVYPGINAEFHPGESKALKYDWIVAPGADPKNIKLRINGANHIEVDGGGDLVLQTQVGELRQGRPVVYQELNGTREEIAGRYALLSRTEVGFVIDSYDKTKQLIIDPPIVYSTYLGGTVRAGANKVATITDSASGNTYVYVVGDTLDPDFPTKNAIQPNPTGYDLFVAKFNLSASGQDSLVYSTYLGGNSDEEGFGIAVDSTGAAYVTGYTKSTNFPLVNAFKTTTDGYDAYVAKLTPDGSALVYSSYLGGSSSDTARGIAVDGTGNTYVGGGTSSTNFPVIHGFRTTPGTGFITKIAPPSGGNPASIVYSSYIDGSVSGIAVDSSANAYAAGATTSLNLPATLSAFQQTNPNPSPYTQVGFVAKVNTLASGSASLLYSTYLGGTTGRFGGGDGCTSIAVDSAGNAYVAGTVTSHDFPTTVGSLKPTFDDDQDVFVVKLDTTKSGASSLVYSTYLGGHGGFTGFDEGWGIAIDSAGNSYVAGTASSPDFPVVNPVQYYSDGLYVTTNEGNSVALLNKGMASYTSKGVALDTSTTPRTIYVAASGGLAHDTVFKSVDGGSNWSPISSLPSVGTINCLALDPKNPATIYVGTDSGVFKSNDAGNTWVATNNGLSYGTTTNVDGFTFDSATTPQTIYVATTDNLYKSVDGGSTWVPTGLNDWASNLVINPTTTPHTLFVGRGYDRYLFRSTDGGNTWTEYFTPACDYCHHLAISGDTSSWPAQILGVDNSTTPATLYLNDTSNSGRGSFLKSTDNGDSWVQTSGEDVNIWQFIIDTSTTPSTLYAANGEIRKSVDGGLSWTSLSGLGGQPFAIDTSSRTSSTPSTIYFFHGGVDRDAFVSELNPTGSALIFSTYLGGGPSQAPTGASDVAVDTQGNIYVVGGTVTTFPTINAFLPEYPGSASLTGFITKLGNASLPSFSNNSVTTQFGVQSGTLTITFPNITGSSTGTQPITTVTQLDSAATTNFSLSNNLGAYEISTTAFTTATPSNPITLAFQVTAINDPAVFNNLQVIHVVNAVPVDATSSRDFSTRTVYATFTSFSPFVIVKGPTDQIADLVKLVGSFNLKQGIENSLDAKLQNAVQAYRAATVKDRATGCNTMSAFMNEVQAQSGRCITLAQAQQLMAAAKQIRASLGCQ